MAEPVWFDGFSLTALIHISQCAVAILAGIRLDETKKGPAKSRGLIPSKTGIGLATHSFCNLSRKIFFYFLDAFADF